MSDEQMDDVGQGMSRSISRRRMLQNIGIASAVAWTAPIVTSIGTKAFAEGSARCPGRDWNCGDAQTICGSGGYLGKCICDVDASGTAFCWADYYCSDSNAIPCTSNSDCAGSAFPRCATTCCGQTCAPECDKAGPHRAPRGGATASGN